MFARRATDGDNDPVERADDTEIERYVVEVRELDRAPRRITITARVELGRECDGIIVEDARVSRRHLSLVPASSTLTVVDLGSTNGTLVNDALISESLRRSKQGERAAAGGSNGQHTPHQTKPPRKHFAPDQTRHIPQPKGD